MATMNSTGSLAYVYEDGDTVVEDLTGPRKSAGFELFGAGQTQSARGGTLVYAVDNGDAPEPDCPVAIRCWFSQEEWQNQLSFGQEGAYDAEFEAEYAKGIAKGIAEQEFDAEIEAAKAALVGLIVLPDVFVGYDPTLRIVSVGGKKTLSDREQAQLEAARQDWLETRGRGDLVAGGKLCDDRGGCDLWVTADQPFAEGADAWFDADLRYAFPDFSGAVWLEDNRDV